MTVRVWTPEATTDLGGLGPLRKLNHRDCSPVVSGVFQSDLTAPQHPQLFRALDRRVAVRPGLPRCVAATDGNRAAGSPVRLRHRLRERSGGGMGRDQVPFPCLMVRPDGRRVLRTGVVPLPI